MPHRNWKLRITDIIEAIEKILSYVEGMAFDEFVDDPKTIDAVIRNITVIGEAARNVPEEVVNRHPSLPWREMQDIRNVVVHEYFGVDNNVVWDTLQRNLPPLLPELKRLIGVEETDV